MDGIVRALDVGYGNVKYISGHTNIGLVPDVNSFPSLALIANENDISGGVLKRRNTLFVEVNSNTYEVGPDASISQGVNDESGTLETGFCMTDGYMARTLGALHYMREGLPGEKNTIDVLVCGLPVSSFTSHKAELQKKMTGTFTLPFGNTMTVKRCMVVPQPLGAYFFYMNSNNKNEPTLDENFKNVNNLIIDPGYFTFDWLFSKGMKAVDKKSGSVNRGMSALIQAMAKSIAKDEKTDEKNAFKILDEAFREGQIPYFFGQPIDIKKYLKKAEGVVNEAVSALASSVGDGSDITNIMLAGGGAAYFAEAIQAKFPRHKVLTCSNPMYSNVIGFQYVGIANHLSLQRAQNKSNKVEV